MSFNLRDAAGIAEYRAGIDTNRPLPRFAPMMLQQWFRRRGGTRNPDGRPVALFRDTFNNHLHTEVGVAWVEAIEEAGWRVVMPEGHVCGGRPLYDCGFLDAAQHYLRNVVDVLRDYVRADTPVVGMEPSCLAVFKDELARVLPHDDARRLVRNSYHFSESFDHFEIPVPAGSGDADDGTLVTANGFSCKTQIEDAGTGRHAWHVAEILRGTTGGSPEHRRPAPAAWRRAARTVAVTVVPAAACAAAGEALRRWRR